LLALAVYFFIFYSETRMLPDLLDQWTGILVAIVLVNMLGFAMIYINTILNKSISWHKNLSLRFVVEVSAGVVLSGFAAIIFIFLFLLQDFTPENEIEMSTVYEGFIKFGILSVVINYVYSLINFSIFSFNQFNLSQIESIKSDRIQLDLRFEALKSQLNPHFLFNALNTISSLIFVDIKRAENYVRQLAQTYDYILTTDETKLVSFQTELKMLRSFFFMHKIRYDDYINLHIDPDLDTLKGLIPPFALQILVENALKHSVISEETPLKIEIFNENNKHLVVRNNIIYKAEDQSSMNILLNRQKASESYKIGLSNIKKRYRFLSNKEIEIIKNSHFTIKLPIISEAYEK
jgi:sensor histidine kinase YesM